MYGETKDAVKSAFFRFMDKADEHGCNVNWWELSEPAFWRGTVPGHIRDAQGWLDPTPPGPCTFGLAWHSIRTYVAWHVALLA